MAEGPAAGNTGATPRRTILIGGAAVAAVVIVVVLLLLSGVLPGVRPNGPGGALPVGGEKYAINFTESGLGSGTSWSVTLAGLTSASASAQIGFLEPDGTYAYHITPPSGFVATPGSGNVTVNGQATRTSILFATTRPPATYDVNFTESGLAASTNWTVTFNGTVKSSTTGPILFSSVNGSFDFSVSNITGYAVRPLSGIVSVRGAGVNESVAFSPVRVPKYTVGFTETGLPSGSFWSVALNGSSNGSTTASVGFSAPNGTYSYTVGNVPGYSSNPGSGSIHVNGAAASVGVVFSATGRPLTDFNFTINETGLPNGTAWTISLFEGYYPGTSAYPFGASSEGSSIILALPNSSYIWSASSNSIFTPSPAYGTFDILGRGYGTRVAFAPPPPPSTTYYQVNFTERGLPAGTNWSVFFNGTGISSTGSTIHASAVNGSDFFAASAAGFGPVYGFVTVAGAPVAQGVNFSPAYTVSFNETGLSTNATWSVDVGGTWYYGTSGTAIVSNETNGTYSFEVITFGFLGQGSYAATPSSGNVTISGVGTNILIRFTPLAQYNVTLAETGLPSGAIWSSFVGHNFLDMIGATGNLNPVSFPLPNGSYVWLAYENGPNTSYVPTALAGSIVVNGHAVQVNVTFRFAPGLHEMEFEESDVLFSSRPAPPSMAWNVSVGGRTYSAVDGFLFLAMPNGSFTFSVLPPAGHLAFPSGGTIVVNDPTPFSVTPYFGNLTIIVDFYPTASNPLAPFTSADGIGGPIARGGSVPSETGAGFGSGALVAGTVTARLGARRP